MSVCNLFHIKRVIKICASVRVSLTVFTLSALSAQFIYCIIITLSIMLKFMKK